MIFFVYKSKPNKNKKAANGETVSIKSIRQMKQIIVTNFVFMQIKKFIILWPI